MKVVSTEALTKLIQLVKSAFIKVDDVVEVTEIETEIPSEIDLATVATSGDYNDLSNKPTIPAAQVNSDWNATSGVAQILNKPTIPTVNDPTITFTQGGMTKGTITLNQSSNQTVAFDAGARNIGQIIQSTIPLTDAGLHLLDGSLIQGGGIYDDFVQYIAGLVNTYSQCFTDETSWQNSVNTYGVCGKFVYDSTNNTVRLPKITGFTEGTTDVIALGDLIQAGLPNITATGTIGTIGSHARPTISGAFVNLRNGSVGSDEPNTTGWLYDLDASQSNAIYGNSDTVQPQSIKVLYYIVIATSTKTDIEVDIDEIATDLNGKADVDLSNVNASGTALASGWGMPSSRYIDLTLGASNSNYTAPANGYFCIIAFGDNSRNHWIEMRNDSSSLFARGVYGSLAWQYKIAIEAKKSDIVNIMYEGINTPDVFRFIYAEGEN